MGKTLIMLSSVTFALKGRDLLRSRGVQATIERTPNSHDRLGCGYSIAVSDDNAGAAVGVLKAAGLQILGTTETI